MNDEDKWPLTPIKWLVVLGILVIIAVTVDEISTFTSLSSVLEAIISASLVVILIIVFTGYIPLLYYSYSINKKPAIKEDISLRFQQTNLKINTIDEKFQEVYGGQHYKTPVLLAVLLTFVGSVLVFFPSGLSGFKGELAGTLSSYVMSIAKGAPPITYGFLGAYFFSVQLLFRRYVQSDLKPEVFMFVNMRFLITLILTFVISIFFKPDQSGEFPDVVLASSFIIGVFPSIGLTFIENKVGALLGIKSDKFREPMPLNAIQGLTMWHEARLLEEDIENVQNLATANIKDLLVTTRFDAQRLMDWVDQALLIFHVGTEKIQDWRKAGIRTATDFMDILDKKETKAKVAKAVGLTEDEIEIIFSALERDPNIQHVSAFWENISKQ